MAEAKRDLTAADVRRYVAEGAGRCPFCGDHGIEGGFVEIVDTLAWQNVHCAACGAEWQDVYHLARIDVVRTPDGRTFEPPDGYAPAAGDDAAAGDGEEAPPCA